MDKPYSSKSDIWSLGCVIYEATSLKPPFRSDSMEGLFKKILNGYYPNIPTNYSKELESVIRSMLQVNPKKRPTCDELAENPIISKKIDELFNCDMEPYENELLETIRCPKNLEALSRNKLPSPAYDGEKRSKVRISEKINVKPSLSKNKNRSRKQSKNEDYFTHNQSVNVGLASPFDPTPSVSPRKLKENNKSGVLKEKAAL